MRHARSDYNRIQDPENIIPADEPVFLIRGQDRAAVPTIKAYALFAEREGASEGFINLARAWATEVETWQSVNVAHVKVPDAPAPDTRHPAPADKCPECATGTLLPPVDGKRVCEQCGYVDEGQRTKD